MKKITRTVLILTFAILTTNLYAGPPRNSSISGDWNLTSTWGGSSVPGSGNAVTIKAGTTVTIDTWYTAIAKSITIEPGGKLIIKKEGGAILLGGILGVSGILAFELNTVTAPSTATQLPSLATSPTFARIDYGGSAPYWPIGPP